MEFPHVAKEGTGPGKKHPCTQWTIDQCALPCEENQMH